VLITTAGALETEAFVLVYLLAFAFLVEWAWREGREAFGRRSRFLTPRSTLAS